MSSWPPIDPTGAMSSGDYVNYMMGYCESAEAYLIDEMPKYVTTSTINEWDALWGRILLDASGSVTTLEKAVRGVEAQMIMVSDAIKSL